MTTNFSAIALACVLVMGLSLAEGAEAQDYVFADDFETIDCTLDTDNDRLNDCVESGTGAFASTLSTGTSRKSADTDGDGLRDGDEILGTSGGLNLPAFGVNPLHKDLLVELDWMVDGYADECEAGSHQFTATAAQLAAATFAASPVANPDGTTGINLIIDHGQGGVFNGATLVDDLDGVIQGLVDEPDFVAQRSANFTPARLGHFHYGISAHRFIKGTSKNSTGQGEISGDEFLITLHCYQSDYKLATALAHELGHNLSLRHGGFDDCGFKPNYNSVMNYRYQFYGVDSDCNGRHGPQEADAIDFSRGLRAPLNESALNETAGVCGAPAIDWNKNLVLGESNVVYDINSEYGTAGQLDHCKGQLTALHDYDDWSNVTLSSVAPSNGAPLPGGGEVAVCESDPNAP